MIDWKHKFLIGLILVSTDVSQSRKCQLNERMLKVGNLTNQNYLIHGNSALNNTKICSHRNTAFTEITLPNQAIDQNWLLLLPGVLLSIFKNFSDFFIFRSIKKIALATIAVSNNMIICELKDKKIFQAQMQENAKQLTSENQNEVI